MSPRWDGGRCGGRIGRAGRRFTAVLLLATTAVLLAQDAREFDLRADRGVYTPERGHGFDFGTSAADGTGFYYSIRVPEGNWRVRAKLGDERAATNATIKAETRRLMVEEAKAAAGEVLTCEFVVNVRTAALTPPPPNAPGGTAVRLNDRERRVLHWDDKLTLEFNGAAPHVVSLSVEPAADVVTVFLAGDSTVTDQPAEPAASWGQMLPRFLGPRIAVANHAESGETLKSFLTSLRLDKLLSAVRPGDVVLVQFGHNDSKAQWPQTFAEAGTTFDAYLRAYVAEVRRRQATPVLVTPVHRRVFNSHGRIENTHGGYLEAVSAVAAEEHVPLIDLAAISATLYEALGPDVAPKAFADGGRDATHHSTYGAYLLARGVTVGLAAAVPGLRPAIPAAYQTFHPEKPDRPEAFQLPASPPRPNALVAEE